jgi:hypothetical protein
VRPELAALAARGQEQPPVNPNVDESVKWSIDRRTSAELMAECRAVYEGLCEGLVTSWQYQRVNNTYGPMSDDPAIASFWFAQVLPVDEYAKAQLLPVRGVCRLSCLSSSRAHVTPPPLRPHPVSAVSASHVRSVLCSVQSSLSLSLQSRPSSSSFALP